MSLRKLICVAILALAPIKAMGQATPIAVVPVVWIEQRVHDRLAHDWSDATDQIERAYCARVARLMDWRYGGIVYIVLDVWKPTQLGTHTTLEQIDCPPFPDVAVLHTHPPLTRPRDWYDGDGSGTDTTYKYGGRTAFQCWPSTMDMTTLLRSGRTFDLIQCDKNAVVPYWRQPYSIFVPRIVPIVDTTRVTTLVTDTTFQHIVVTDTTVVVRKQSLLGKFWAGLRRIF